MIIKSQKNKPFALSLLAGVAGVMLAGSAYAAPVYTPQGTYITPQTEPAAQERYIYSRTEITRMPEAQYQYRDGTVDNYQATTTEMRRTDVNTTVNPNNIRYMSGGIGQAEQAQLREAEADYSTKVVFANTNGAFMSDLDVTVKDSAGETVLGLTTDGPVLLMDLEPGTYTLTANDGGEVKTRKLSVTGSTRTYTLHFTADEPLGYAG